MAPAAAISLQASLSGLWLRAKQGLARAAAAEPSEQQPAAPAPRQQTRAQRAAGQTMAASYSAEEARELFIQWCVAPVAAAVMRAGSKVGRLGSSS